MRVPHKPPTGQPSGTTDGTNGTNLSDKIAIIAQKYAGYFTGSSYRFDQQSIYTITDTDHRGIHINKKWKEPVVISDDCPFCERLTDEEAERRVAGFQHQIDIEVLRSKNRHYQRWLLSGSPDIIEWEEVVEKIAVHPESTTFPREYIEERRIIAKTNSQANRRRFCELFQDEPRVTGGGDERPNGWKVKPLPMIALPLRLKRKLCIEWNHVYRDYLAENPGVYYDFDTKNFYTEMPEPSPCPDCGGEGAYDGYGRAFIIHKSRCVATVSTNNVPDNPLADAVQEWLDETGGVGL